MATIDDVAKQAGVSKSTVSSVFSKKRPISKEVTERVLKVAEQLEYKPNYWARTLTSKKTSIIGIRMHGEKVKFSQFHLALLNGVLKECYDAGYRLLVNTLSPEYLGKVEHISSDPVDGEIFLDPDREDPRILEKISQGKPLVIVGRPPEQYEPHISYVDNDNVLTAERVTEYLFSLGHRKILFLNAPKSRTVSEDREKGYRKAYANADLFVDDSLIEYRDEKASSSEYGYMSTKRFLEVDRSITAVISDSDKVALGVYKCASEMNLRIPEDLSVFAFSDDSVFAPQFAPPLSGVKLNAETLGSEAAKLLIRQCAQEKQTATRVLIPTELVFRNSCAEAKRR